MKIKIKIMDLLFISTLLTAVFGVTTVILQQVEKSKMEKESKLKDQKLEDYQNQLKEKTEELKKYVTGDSTIPKLYALILNEEGKIKFHLSNESKYPIPDIHVHVQDITKAIEVKDKKINYKAPNDAMQININVGTLAPL